MSCVKNVSSICWSADVSASEMSHVISEKPLPLGTVIKLDQVFLEKYSKEYIAALQAAGYPVFVDRKICEMPEKVLQIAEIYLRYQPFMLNAMAGICSTGRAESRNINKIDALKRFADLCREANTRSCIVTVLTSKTDCMVAREYTIKSPREQVQFYAELASAMGVTDITCSARDIDYLHATSYRELEVEINTPGIRLPQTDERDQVRITTPANAFLCGSDRLIIGSNLTDGDGDITERLRRNYDRLLAHLDEYDIAIR